MKKTMLILTAIWVIFFNAILVSAEVFGLDYAEDVKVITVEPIPANLPIGTMAIITNLAKVRLATITVQSYGFQSESYESTIDVSDFDGLSELKKQLQRHKTHMHIKDPEAQISYNVTLGDGFGYQGNHLFTATSWFTLEKITDKSGNVSYQPPSWATFVWFYPTERVIDFPMQVEYAYIDNNGEKGIILEVRNGNQIIVPGSGYSTRKGLSLIIVTGDGNEIKYDFRTGQRINPTDEKIGAEYVGFEGIQHMDTVDDSLCIELSPEYGYNPWIETDFGTEPITLDVRSYHGYKPIAVWVTQLDNIRDGQMPTPTAYYDGMKIEGTGTIFIWFEFPKEITGAYTIDGKG